MDYMEPPDNPGTFGTEFNYSVWTAGTTITLCNVPWYSDYRDVVGFDTDADLDRYLSDRSGPSITLSNMTYARPGDPIRINVPFNNAYTYNYLRVHNDKMPVGGQGRTFYYFISDVRYLAPNTTELVVQLDVWQTFIRTIELGNSYVQRGHIGIANSNQMNDYGRRYLALPEGMDTGSELQITNYWSEGIANNDWHSEDSYDVLVVSTVSLENSGGTIDDPVLRTAKGSGFEGLPNGCSLYIMDQSGFSGLMSDLSDLPWISQGIIGVYAVPPVIAKTINDRYDLHEINPDWHITSDKIYLIVSGGDVARETLTLQKNWRDSARANIPDRYRHLSKFLTYPYCVVELTTHSGNPLLLKPESIASDDLESMLLIHIAPPNPRAVMYPLYYNASGYTKPVIDEDGQVINDHAEFLDSTTGIFNMPTFSMVNNSYMSYMASNAHSIAYQHSQADWAQQRALTGNQVEFNQASQNMALQNQLNNMNVGAMRARTELANTTGGYRAITGAVGSVAGGIMGGTPGTVASGVSSAAMSGVNHAIDVNHRNQTLGIESSLANRTTAAQVQNSAYMRDTNKEYADFVAKGDYEQAIASINAKVQDAKMIQPTTSGQMGGDAFNLVYYGWRLDAKVKMVQSGAMETIGEYWLRYGYLINRFMKPPQNLKVMKRFSYWKLLETYITSSYCPESFKQAIRGILEKGVTVWNNPDDIGMIDIGDNEPIERAWY